MALIAASIARDDGTYNAGWFVTNRVPLLIDALRASRAEVSEREDQLAAAVDVISAREDRPIKVPTVEAVVYGRSVLEREFERLQDFEAQAAAKGDTYGQERWRQIRQWLSWKVLGEGEGCVVTAFDARWLDESFRSMASEVGQPTCTCDDSGE